MFVLLQSQTYNYTNIIIQTIILMKLKSDRIETLKMLISSNEMGSQEEVLEALAKEGYQVTQATLSRDFKDRKSVV